MRYFVTVCVVMIGAAGATAAGAAITWPQSPDVPYGAVAAGPA